MMKKTVAVSLAFVGAAFIAVYGACALLLGNWLGVSAGWKISAIVFAEIAAGLLIAGGILTLCNKKIGFILAACGLVVSMLVIVPCCIILTKIPSGVVAEMAKWLKSLAMASRIISPLAAIGSLLVMPKINGFVTNVICGLFSLLAAVVFGWRAYFAGGEQLYMVVFIILGAAGCLLSVLGGVFAAKKSDKAFGMTLMALMIMAGQFIFGCALCTTLSGIVNIILAFCGLIMAIIGGVLIADSRESGFIVVSFGIIFLLGWVLYVFFLVNKAVAIGLLCVMAGTILTAASVLRSRIKNEQ